MTRYEFNALSEDSQEGYWASAGRYLAQPYEDDYRIGLYAVNAFFVEACRAADGQPLLGRMIRCVMSFAGYAAFRQ